MATDSFGNVILEGEAAKVRLDMEQAKKIASDIGSSMEQYTDEQINRLKTDLQTKFSVNIENDLIKIKDEYVSEILRILGINEEAMNVAANELDKFDSNQ